MIELNGIFAVLMVAFGALDNDYRDCSLKCFEKSHDAIPRLSVSAGTVGYQRRVIGEEIYLRYDRAVNNGPFQHIMGASVTSDQDIWLGLGHAYSTKLGQSDFYTELHAMTGLYFQGNGQDLGGLLEFRSGIEVGYELKSGWRMGLSLDHRSNAELGRINPGLETFQVRISAPL